MRSLIRVEDLYIINSAWSYSALLTFGAFGVCILPCIAIGVLFKGYGAFHPNG